jgi:MarR family transcriptional regulator, organic hydroperoxide resistance regulator
MPRRIESALDTMTTMKSLTRSARITRGGAAPQKAAASAADRFPPLSTSLETFVKDGSDRRLRRLIYDLTSLFNGMVSNRRHFAAYMGVSEAQALMMFMIAETQDATVGQVAQRFNVSSQFATIEIGDLVKNDIVEKRPNEADRRSMFLRLTAKGKNLLRELAPLRRQANDTHWRSLTEDRATILQEILSDLIVDGRAALHELDAPHLLGKMAPSAQA